VLEALNCGWFHPSPVTIENDVVSEVIGNVWVMLSVPFQ
jgi:hypothetical protein